MNYDTIYNVHGDIKSISGTMRGNFVNPHNQPIHTMEKDNKKILQYDAKGLSHKHINVEEKWINKTKEMTVLITGEFEDEITGFKNDINIKLSVDYNVYNEVTYEIQDGILTVALHEIENEKPEVSVYQDFFRQSLRLNEEF